MSSFCYTNISTSNSLLSVPSSGVTVALRPISQASENKLRSKISIWNSDTSLGPIYVKRMSDTVANVTVADVLASPSVMVPAGAYWEDESRYSIDWFIAAKTSGCLISFEELA